MNPLAQLFKILFFLFALWLAVNNMAAVELRLSSTWSISLPLIAILLLCIVIGAVACALALAPRLYRMRRMLKAKSLDATENLSSSAGTHSGGSELAGRKSAKKMSPPFAGERIVDAARNIGAAGELDPDTRSRR